MSKTIDALKLALEALEEIAQGASSDFEDAWCGAIAENVLPAIREALAEPSEALMSVPDGAHATTEREQPAPVAEPHEQHDCSRSHPHENMDAMCELRTEIARLTNENARLKAKQQSDEVNAYRMTLLCIRDGLQQGMSKSIQKLQAREINDMLGMPSFASYRTSPSASPSQGDIKPWVGLTDEERDEIYNTHEPYADLKAIEAKLREKNEPREKNA